MSLFVGGPELQRRHRQLRKKQGAQNTPSQICLLESRSVIFSTRSSHVVGHVISGPRGFESSILKAQTLPPMANHLGGFVSGCGLGNESLSRFALGLQMGGMKIEMSCNHSFTL